jgi:uncharacterized protein YxeA
MDKKIVYIVVAVIIIISLVALFTIFKQDYRKFKAFSYPKNCITYTEDCTCFGLLYVMESYPPKYDCDGLNFCRDINITECK